MANEIIGEPIHPGLRTLQEVRDYWLGFLALGIALIVLGVIALSYAVITTAAAVIVYGSFLLIGGGLQTVYAFWARQWSGFFLHLLAGVLDVVVGFLLIAHPAAGALVLTLLLAAYFLVGGIFRIVAALMTRYHNWGWLLLSGVITLLLGLMIWWQWPLSGLWVIGLFVGIDMIFNGWSWVALALAARSFRMRSA
ncbi:MAG: HdeD family acid-resistance protein [Isosphaeraceae bacterium]|nr:HdeD family acid-resistance protein [Isosphaeraceae bacterium]